jgi:Na+-transporting NADH:ubiquinone oxidoreductase subunit NqrB
MFPMQARIFRDARYFQIFFQSVFLGYGIYHLHWETEWWIYLMYFGTGFATQLIAEIVLCGCHGNQAPFNWQQRYLKGIPSICISSLGLCLLLRTNEPAIIILAAALAILSKYLLRYRGKNIFNPSALSIVAAMLTGHAWISPGQWGSSAILVFAVCCFGFVITTRVQKLDTSLAFLGTFSLLLYTRQVIYLGWPADYLIPSALSGSILLFSFFMITDPKTTPNHASARIVWAAAVGAGSFYLSAFHYINGSPIYVLLCAQLFVPLIDRICIAGKFEWISRAGPHDGNDVKPGTLPTMKKAILFYQHIRR